MQEVPNAKMLLPNNFRSPALLPYSLRTYSVNVEYPALAGSQVPGVIGDEMTWGIGEVSDNERCVFVRGTAEQTSTPFSRSARVLPVGKDCRSNPGVHSGQARQAPRPPCHLLTARGVFHNLICRSVTLSRREHTRTVRQCETPPCSVPYVCCWPAGCRQEINATGRVCSNLSIGTCTKAAAKRKDQAG